MNIKRLKKILKTKKILSKSKFKYLCVTITTNTSYENKKIHCAPLRHIENILIFGIVVYSTKQLHHLTKFFDKSIDIIFVDTEKKYLSILEINIKKLHN